MKKSSAGAQQTSHTTQSAWDSHVAHPLQTWEWGEFRASMGIDVVRFPQYWQMTFHPIPHTPFTVGYFPKGPLPDASMMKKLMEVGRQKNAIYIQLEPNYVLNDLQSTIDDQLIPSHHPLFTKYTFVLNLTKSEEELLQTMHPKTRYNIKVAQKHGVVVREDSSNEAFDAYLRLSSETTRRQGFYAHNETYHRSMWETVSKSGLAKLFTATYNGEVLTAWIIFCFKDTIYYPYGASSRNHREAMAPNLMLWEIAKWGKAHGYKKFDLWGALGPTAGGTADGRPDEHDPWYGFHRFKEGYRPELVEYIGSYDLVIKPFLYQLYCIADNFRWSILKIKSKR